MFLAIYFKHSLLKGRLANQRQISRGESVGRVNKVFIDGPGKKIAALPIYGQHLKNLQNQKSHDLESWNVLSETQELQNLYK